MAEPRRSSRFLTFACRFILAAVFLMAGATKVTDFRAFADQILIHSGLPQLVGWPVVVFLPWLELTCGFCLAVGYATRESAALLSGLLMLFLAYSLFHTVETDCHCFWFPRVIDQTPWWWTSVRNLSLLLCGLRVAFR